MTNNKDTLTNERFQLAKEAADLGVWEWNVEEDTLNWDDRTIELFGLSPDGGVEEFFETVHPEDRDIVRNAVNEAVEKGTSFHHRYRIQKDGTTYWIEAHGKWLNGDIPNRSRLIGTVRDVTDEMSGKRELEIFEQAVDQLPDEIYVIEPETARILDVTGEVERTLGYARDELLSMRIHDIDPAAREEFNWEKRANRIIQNGPLTFEATNQRKDGRTYPVEIHADYTEIEGEGRIIATCRDITERKEQERQIQKERKRFRQMAENIREVFWLTPSDKSDMLYISPAYEDIWGRTREELYRNPASWIEAIHPEDRERVRNALPGQRTGEYDEEYRIVRPDGEVRWIRDRAYTISGDSGEVERVVGVAEDITERKEIESSLRKSEKLYRTLFEEANEGFIIESLDDRVLAVNRSACESLGYSSEELEEMRVKEITPPEIRKECGETGIARYHLDTYGTSLYNCEYLHKDGSTVPVAKSMAPIEYHGTDAVLVCIRDQSELERIRKQSQRKSSFVTQVTHDLRTPLNSITGMGDLLMDTDLTGEQQRLLKTIVNASRNMERLTNDIIDLNRIERGELILDEEPFDLERQLGEVISLFSHEVEERDVILSSEVSEEVPNRLVGDPDRLKQILHNLLDNAIENTEKGYIQVKVERLDQENDHVTLSFSVSDTGKGIPESKRDTIFQQHEQIETRELGSATGLGLGLSICRNLVEQMGGEISVQSEEGKGSTFSFLIELEKADMEENESTASLTDVRVLLVEDNTYVRQVFRAYLEAKDVNVIECETGEEALEELSAFPEYDVVFMDQRLDDMNGVDILETVAASKNGINTKRIYIISGDPSEQIEQLIGTVPHAGILEKPIDESRLISAVSTVVAAQDQKEQEESDEIREDIKQEHSESLQILVADDDQNTRTLLNELLSPLTETLTFVTNGKEAVDKRFDGSYDLILLDLEMPEMSGVEATERIRKKEKEKNLPAVPIITQTARAMKHVEAKCLEAGVDKFVPKPIKRSRLYRSIREVLS